MRTIYLRILAGFPVLLSSGMALAGNGPPPVLNVPALSTEGLIGAAVALALAGAYVLARRK